MVDGGGGDDARLFINMVHRVAMVGSDYRHWC